jgi:MscS family membrane protein
MAEPIMTESADQLLTFIENPLVRAGAIVGVSVLLAFVLRLVLIPLVRRIVRRSSTGFDDALVDRFGLPLVLTVMVLGVIIAMIVLPLPERVEQVGRATLWTVLILVWGRAVTGAGELIFDALSRNTFRLQWIQPKTLPLIDFMLKVGIIAAQLYLIFLTWNIDVTHWIASAGVAGLVIGLAAKDTLANLFSGMFILADAPYKVGDFIILTDGLRGRVTEIGIRSTRLLTRDDIEVTLPNALIGNGKIVNESSGPYEKMRVRVQVSVAYGSDVDTVEKILLAATDGVPELAAEPAPRVRMRSFDDSGLAFELLAWVDQPIRRGRALHVMNRAVYKALGKAGIEIPYPKRDLYVKELPRRTDRESRGPDRDGAAELT